MNAALPERSEQPLHHPARIPTKRMPPCAAGTRGVYSRGSAAARYPAHRRKYEEAPQIRCCSRASIPPRRGIPQQRHSIIGFPPAAGRTSRSRCMAFFEFFADHAGVIQGRDTSRRIGAERYAARISESINCSSSCAPSLPRGSSGRNPRGGSVSPSWNDGATLLPFTSEPISPRCTPRMAHKNPIKR